LNFVNGVPSGCRMTSETVVGLPGVIGPAGVKSTIWYVLAAPTEMLPGVDEPPPQPATARASRPSPRSRFRR
jgi:hypothetical protein